MIVAAIAVAAWRGWIAGPIPSGLVLDGAVANLADRLHGGSVIDLFDLGWWPTFNAADVFVVGGKRALISCGP